MDGLAGVTHKKLFFEERFSESILLSGLELTPLQSQVKQGSERAISKYF